MAGDARRRTRDLRRRYGISVAEFDELYRQQGGKCAICKQVPEPMRNGRSSMHVDHDHATGLVRGLLCHRCNTALGLLRESRRMLKAIDRYLAWGEFRAALAS